MRVLRVVILGMLALALAPATSSAAPTKYSLANGCYSLRSNATGRYVALQPDGHYAATAQVQGAAEPFRMKASALGRYLLYGTRGDFLAKGPKGIVAARAAGPGADWRVQDAGPARFSMALRRSHKALAASSRGRLGITARSAGAGDDFSFDRTSGCRVFPEAADSAKGSPFKASNDLGEVKGTLDAHAHITAFEFLGGDFHCGRPWSPYGIAAALPDCASIQGPGGSAAPVQNFLDYGEPVHPHDTVGYPTFNDWPAIHGLSYEGTYWKWIERSWKAGLRVMVTQLVENDALCELMPKKHNSCNEMDSARLQRNDLYALQNYIDAQYGGPGKGFLRVVTDPWQARKVVSEGKLAVVMGMETSSLFDCKEYNDVPTCSQGQINAGLDQFRKLGVRSFFPVHKFDNAFGGTKMDGGALGAVINNGNKLETGSYWNIQTCTGAEEDNPQLNPGDAGLASALSGTPLAAIIPGGQTPVYPPAPHCNTRGLTNLGDYLIKRLMDTHSVVEIDHMDARSRNQTLALLEARRYSGVISAHSWASPLNYPRIYKLGGLVTPSASDASGFVKEWAAYRKMRDPHYYFGFGYGSDMNGLAVQGAPTPGKPVVYPFKSLDGKVSFNRDTTGQRTFDYNKDGVAQYGLYADWLDNIRQLGGSPIADEMNRGAEAYLQMWERTDGIPRTSCRSATAAVTSKALGHIRLGATARSVLQRAGQPSSRPGSYYRWCVKRSHGAATAAFDSHQKAVFVGSTAKLHRSGRIHPGAKVSKLQHRAKRISKSVWVGKALNKRGVRRVFLVRKGRVKVIGVATRSLIVHHSALGKALKTAAKGNVSTLQPKASNASIISVSPAAASAAAQADPHWALCVLTLNQQ